jgi:hypothetical protein
MSEQWVPVGEVAIGKASVEWTTYAPHPDAPGKEAEWALRRPTYDELALAVLAFQRAYGRDPWHDPWKPGHWDDWEKVGETLCDLARRLEPGP